MNGVLRKLTVFAAFALIGAGCVSFPKGTETYTAEFPTFVGPTAEAPAKTYEADVVVEEADESHSGAIIGLVGKVTSKQPRIQHYDIVTVEKKKKLAFGFFPSLSENDIGGLSYSSKRLATTRALDYKHGMYRSGMEYNTITCGGCGGTLWELFKMHVVTALGLALDIPYALLYEPFFGSWECDSHHWTGANIEYLDKFSPEERRKIGAWTSFDYEEHPTAPSRWFLSHIALVGFHRYSDYEIHNPVESSKTTPVPSKTTIFERNVYGPYTMTLDLPALGFKKNIDVLPGLTFATISLPSAAKGRSFANGTIRFQMPPGGQADVHDADNLALLKLAIQREWPVAVALPSKRE